jgi:hypothetical protein
MSTESNDQYRAGFEAHARTRHLGLERARIASNTDYARSETNEAWLSWVASKREASTEPSAWMCPNSFDPEFTVDALLAGYWMRKGRTVTPLYAGVGALSDDAKDAKPYRWGSAMYWSGGKVQDGIPHQCNEEAQEVLADIFCNSERPDKMTVEFKINGSSNSFSVVYEDTDEEWFKELVAAIEAHKTGSDHGQG